MYLFPNPIKIFEFIQISYDESFMFSLFCKKVTLKQASAFLRAVSISELNKVLGLTVSSRSSPSPVDIPPSCACHNRA